MFGITGYQPAATGSVDELLRSHGARLRALVGRRLDSATGLCFVLDGGWCATLPLVLDFEGSRLELVFDGFDQTYLSWDTIGPDTPIDTPEQDDPELALAWGDPCRAELDHVRGAVVRQVAVLEHEFQLDRADGRRLNRWLLAGLELAFDEGRELRLYNVFSELTLATGTAGAGGWRRHAVRG